MPKILIFKYLVGRLRERLLNAAERELSRLNLEITIEFFLMASSPPWRRYRD
jgi:hypothetical protein